MIMGELDGLSLSQLMSTLESEGFSPEWGEAVLRAGKNASAKELLQLSELLRVGDKDLRSKVAAIMADIADSYTLRLLVESALEDEDEGVVKIAVAVLMHMREAAVDLLKEVMEGTSGIVRVRAALILAEIGNAQGIEILIEAIGHAAEIEDEDTLPRILKALGQLGQPRVVKSLVDVLTGGNWLLRPVAAKALVSVGEPAVDALLAVIENSQDWDARCRAAEAIGQIGSVRAAKPLVTLLRENQGFVQYEIIEALGRIGDPASVEVLISALTDGDPTMRFRAGVALVHMGNRAVKSLSRLVYEHPDADVRRSVTEALGRIGNEGAVPVLIYALQDESNRVRRAAAEALGRLKDSRAVVPLCQALEDGNLFVVRAAADALAQVGDVQAIGPLLKALSDGRSEVRRRIIKALESFGPIVETLTAGLDRGSSRAKMGIAEALAELGGQKATEALFQALEDSDREVRVSIARALVYLGEGDVRRRLEAIVEERGPGADEVREELKRSLKK